MRWDHDPAILQRLETVAIMHLQGASLRQIGEALQTSRMTAKRDLERVYTLWERQVAEKTNTHRLRAVAQYEHIQQQAWAAWRDQPDDAKNATFLRVAMEAEAKLDDLRGVTPPQRHEHSGPGGGPIRLAKEFSDDELAACIQAGGS